MGEEGEGGGKAAASPDSSAQGLGSFFISYVLFGLFDMARHAECLHSCCTHEPREKGKKERKKGKKEKGKGGNVISKCVCE